MLDSFTSIQRFRNEGSRDMMVAAANYEVANDQNGHAGEFIEFN